MRAALRLVLTAPALVVGCSDDAPRVGVVDVQEAFQRSPLLMVSAHGIKADLGSSQRELVARGRALAELRQQLLHGGLELEAAQRAELEARVEEESARLVELQVVYRTQLAQAQERRGEEMIARVEEMAREVARREGLTLLLRRDGILYAEEDSSIERVDLTEQVARALLEKINPTEIPAQTAP